MKVEIRRVERELAGELLKRNGLNRPLDENVVDQYSARMKKGIWGDDSDPVRLNKKGELLNGQHRLSAIVRSGVPLNMVIVSDLDNDAFKTMDCGKRRTGTDVLGIHGVKRNTTSISNVLTGVCEYKTHGKITLSPRFRHREMTGTKLVFEWDALGERKQKFLEDCVKISRTTKGCKVSGLLLATVGFLFGEKHFNHFSMFCKLLRTGEGLTSAMGVYHLRERMMRLASDRLKMTKVEETALIIKAFDAFVRGKEIRQLRWASQESFPAIPA